MGKAEEMKGKTVTFFLGNKPMSGKILGFKIPGYRVKIGSNKEVTIPAMALPFCKIEE